MNKQLDSIVWETICICLEEQGVTGEQLDKAEEAINNSLKETNFLHNSVNDSNYFAAEERKEDKRIISLKEDIVKIVGTYEEEIADLKFNLRMANNKIQDLLND